MEGKKPKILLCEDDPNLGMVLKNYLELSDFDDGPSSELASACCSSGGSRFGTS